MLLTTSVYVAALLPSMKLASLSYSRKTACGGASMAKTMCLPMLDSTIHKTGQNAWYIIPCDELSLL
jgi:hypothetical protein